MKHQQRPPKIFGIGLPKTGTSSLRKAFRMLRYKEGSPHDFDSFKVHTHIGDYNCIGLDRYKELHQKYKHAKFIITLRDSPQSWYKSIKHEYEARCQNEKYMKTFTDIYGDISPIGNKKFFTQLYIDYAKNVFEYFKCHEDNWQEKLLVMSMDDGDDWDDLCPFLGVLKPKWPFPYGENYKRKKHERNTKKDSVPQRP